MVILFKLIVKYRVPAPTHVKEEVRGIKAPNLVEEHETMKKTQKYQEQVLTMLFKTLKHLNKEAGLNLTHQKTIPEAKL